MHLRHLIVLIIDARNWPAPLEKAAWSSGKERINHVFRRACLIGQIKKNQNSRAVAVSRQGVPQTSSSASLYDFERSGSRTRRLMAAKLALLSATSWKFRGTGGAGRDRTDDLKLAKLPLSQLSYGPNANL